MRNVRRMGAVLMALALVLSLNLTAFAAVEDTGFSDVAADAWYWNMVHGTTPEEVRQDAEGMQTMRILGRNIAFFLKCKESALAHGLGLPAQEPFQFTNFVR